MGERDEAWEWYTIPSDDDVGSVYGFAGKTLDFPPQDSDCAAACTAFGALDFVVKSWLSRPPELSEYWPRVFANMTDIEEKSASRGCSACSAGWLQRWRDLIYHRMISNRLEWYQRVKKP